jgi:hypothetical protein
VIDLGPRARLVFAATWLAAQATLVATGNLRADHAFGFQMFSEASTLSVHLERRVDSMTGPGTALVDVRDGEWTARDARGLVHHFSWRDRVKDQGLATFDATIFASYGEAAQLARLQAALDDVARHIEGDTETRALAADVTVRKNGGEAFVVHLESAARGG